MKKFIAALLLVLVLPPAGALASEYYTITDFEVYMEVNENNTFDIYETIDVVFHQERRGIIWNIPLTNEIIRNDGTSSTNKPHISNVFVNEPYTQYNEDGKLNLRIGEEDVYITGEKQYIIRYTYDIGKDPVKDADELYHNLIGNGWDTMIENFSFMIAMPKDFDPELPVFTSGAFGSTDSSKVTYEVGGRVITGRYNGKLKPGEAVTIRLTLPEGYFTGANEHSGFSMWILLWFIIPVLTGCRCLYVEKKYRSQKRAVVETVEYYPPDGLNSAEIGYIYNYGGDIRAAALLIELANKGFLRIRQTEEKSGKPSKEKKGSFIITKTNDVIDNVDLNENERTFLTGLFATKDEVCREDLVNNFYKTVKETSRQIEQKFADTIINKTVKNLRGNLIGLLAAFAFIICIISLFDIVFWESFLAWGATLAIAIWFYCTAPKKTPEGYILFGRIRGFRSYLSLVEKPKLEELVASDPEYFYSILPYTYALGVSDTWIGQFESINVKPPHWFSGPDIYDVRGLNSFVSLFNSSSAEPSSSSDGSGGGSSGGGSGGSGGSSW